MIRILLVDDHRIFLDGLKALFREVADFQIIGEAENGVRAIELCALLNPDVVVVDVQMPEKNGIEVTKEIVKQNAGIRVIGLTMLNESLYIKRMLEAGAHGYIIKTADKEELIEAIYAVMRGEKFLGKGVADTLVNNFNDKSGSLTSPLESLTRREKEILVLIAQGLTDKQIAEMVFLSPLTVISHRKNILSKLGLKNKVELTRFAFDNKLTS
ncbi:MAG: response regulator transcription factor [Bacteroidetes bacterium]|nr:response regulator transcription factor [Bacteroidota bacterium]